MFPNPSHFIIYSIWHCWFLPPLVLSLPPRTPQFSSLSSSSLTSPSQFSLQAPFPLLFLQLLDGRDLGHLLSPSAPPPICSSFLSNSICSSFLCLAWSPLFSLLCRVNYWPSKAHFRCHQITSFLCVSHFCGIDLSSRRPPCTLPSLRYSSFCICILSNYSHACLS